MYAEWHRRANGDGLDDDIFIALTFAASGPLWGSWWPGTRVPAGLVGNFAAVIRDEYASYSLDRTCSQGSNELSMGAGARVGLTTAHASSGAGPVTDQQPDHAPVSRSLRRPWSQERRAARIAELQARYGQPRVRAVDDHMFAVGGGAWYPATFRL